MSLPLPHPGRTRRRFSLLLAAHGLQAAAPAGSQPVARTLAVGPGQRWSSLQAAVSAADSGDTIEIEPGDYHADVAVVRQARLTIRGLGTGAVFHADGRVAQDKAILVAQGSDLAVENCEFRGARAADGNGAGIRFERGWLQVRGCRFFDNEMGLLANNDPTQALVVVDCEFGAAPRHPGLLHHLLYVGAIGSFTLCGSRFGQGWRGHLVKTRARRNRILYNRLDDGPDGQASYELEFPNGGDNVVLGNVIVQSPRSQNPTIVSMGAEARDGMAGSLLLAHNTLVNLGGAEGRFVQVWRGHLAGTTPVRMVNNLFVGPGDLDLPGADDAGGNHRVGLQALRDAPGGDDRLALGSALIGGAVPLPVAQTPRAEFSPPSGTRLLPDGLRLSPGALQALPSAAADRKR